jgi:hypothetical protein
MRSLRIFLVGVATVTVLLFGTGAAFADEPPLFDEPGWNPNGGPVFTPVPGLACTITNTCAPEYQAPPDFGIGTPAGQPNGGSATPADGDPSVTDVGTDVTATDVAATTASKGEKARRSEQASDAVTSSSDGGSSAGLLVAAGIVAAGAAAGGVLVVRKRRSTNAQLV